MARKIQSIAAPLAAGGESTIGLLYFHHGLPGLCRSNMFFSIRCLTAALLAVAAILASPSFSKAESSASKNRQGNRLYAQSKYEEAEKAYLGAAVNSPGKPEILYNLGNSLIRQKKYDQGIQALRQSISKGDKEIKENSWFNTGNALFSMGDYKAAAESFIQALKLDPADKEAKHNLELALRKLNQQEQKQSSAGQKQPNAGNTSPEQPSTGKESQNAPSKQDQERAGKENRKAEPPKPQTGQADRRAGSISKDKAEQILDAVQNQEREQQRQLLENRARQRTNEKDW
jgi:Ca-activated chloride channel homolog